MKSQLIFLLFLFVALSLGKEKNVKEHAQSLFQKITGQKPEPEPEPGIVEKVKDFASDAYHKVTGDKVDADDLSKKASELKKHPKETAEKMAEEAKPGIIGKMKDMASSAIHIVTGDDVDVDEAAKKAKELKNHPSKKHAEDLAEEVKPGIIDKAKGLAQDAIHKVTGEKVDVDEAAKKAEELKKHPSKKNAEKLAEEVKPGIIDKAKGLAQDAIHKVTGEKADVDEVAKKAEELRKHPSKEKAKELGEETGIINKMKDMASNAMHKVTGEDVDVDEAAKKVEELKKHPSKKNAEKLAEEVKPGVTDWVKDHVQGAYDKITGKTHEAEEKKEGVKGWVKEHVQDAKETVQDAYDKITGNQKPEPKKGVMDKIQDAAESFRESVTGVAKDTADAAKDKLKK